MQCTGYMTYIRYTFLLYLNTIIINNNLYVLYLCIKNIFDIGIAIFLISSNKTAFHFSLVIFCMKFDERKIQYYFIVTRVPKNYNFIIVFLRHRQTEK